MSRTVGRVYLPLDVEFMEDDRIIEAGEKAGWLYLAMCLRAKRLLSDGKLTARQVSRLPVSGQSPRLKALVDVGLIRHEGDGYRITAWDKHNRTAAAIQEKADQKAAASRMANHQRWHVERGVSEPRCDLCSEAESESEPSADPTSESIKTETETETETVPSDSRPTKPRKKPGTPTPDLFPITPAMAAWGRENAPLIASPQLETAQFLDYHRAKGSIHSDWTAAWHNWMRRAQKYAAEASGRPTPTAGSGNPHTAWVREQG